MMQQTIFITGGASGIGQEIARRFAQQGADLALFDLQFSDAAKTIIEEKRQSSAQKIEYYDIDVTEFSGLKAALNVAEVQVGLPDIALHCAGIQNAGPFESFRQSDFEKVIAVNLFGSRNFAEGCIPLLKKNPEKSRLVFVASLAGLVGNYGYAAYSASKFGVVGLAQVLRMELQPEAVQVQVICPPEVDTPMVHEEYKRIHPVTLKLKLMAGTLSLNQAVNEIMRGLNGKGFYIIPGRLARVTFRMSRWLPGFITHAVADSIIKKELERIA